MLDLPAGLVDFHVRRPSRRPQDITVVGNSLHTRLTSFSDDRLGNGCDVQISGARSSMVCGEASTGVGLGGSGTFASGSGLPVQ